MMERIEKADKLLNNSSFLIAEAKVDNNQPKIIVSKNNQQILRHVKSTKVLNKSTHCSPYNSLNTTMKENQFNTKQKYIKFHPI